MGGVRLCLQLVLDGHVLRTPSSIVLPAPHLHMAKTHRHRHSEGTHACARAERSERRRLRGGIIYVLAETGWLGVALPKCIP